MKNTFWRRLAALVATAGLLGSLAVVGAASPVLAADDCTGAGFVLNPGVDCTVTGAHVLSGSVTFNETLHMTTGSSLNTSAADTTITVDPGSVIMDIGSAITGGGRDITINVPHGDMTMHGTPLAGTDKCGYPNTPAPGLGAQITSTPGSLGTKIEINVGNFPNSTSPSGSFTMERCSLVDVSTGGSSAGTVLITAGHDADIDGQVLSESTLTGTGANQAPGGGPITVQTGCKLTVSSTGVISSRGADPGADLVHLEGCDVFIDGLVQSTGPGHGVPNNPANHCASGVHSAKPANTTACIEIIGQNITISNTGEVNADINSTGAGGTAGESWIDLFAYDNITINGRTAAGATFAVHADSYSNTETSPNTVTAKAGHDSGALGTFTGSGRILSATAQANGSNGGAVIVEASGAVSLSSGTVMAAGDNVGGGGANPPPCDGGAGACGEGGTIDVRSFNSFISWLNGVGDVNPDRAPSPPAGAVSLTACTTVNTTGTNFDDAVPTVQATTYTDSAGVAHALGNPLCGGLPTVPSYVDDAFETGEPIWDACTTVTLDSTTTTTIHLGPGSGDDASAPGITSAPIGSTVHDLATVTGTGPTPMGSVTFTWFNNTGCTPGSGVAAGAVALVAGIAHPSSDETLTASGGSFQASYSGDANYNPSLGACEPLTAGKLSSSTVTVIHLGTSVGEGAPVVAPATAPIGTIVHDKATVSGSGPAPTGTVAFTWYTNTTCTGDGVSAGATVAVGAGGVAHPSSDETLTSTGGSFRAVYSGDGNYLTSTGDCEPIAASKLSSSTVTVIHLGTSVGEGAPVVAPATAPIGTIVHDKATVSGSGPAPTGTVAFTWYTNTTCTGDGVSAGATVAVGAGGVAHPSSDETLTSTGGSFRAVYSGDGNYLTSTGDCEPIAASKLSSSTVTVIHLGTSVGEGAPVVAPATAPIGTIVHDKATVSGSGPAPTGTVAFTWYTNTTCTGDGVSAGATVAVGAGGVAHPSSDETLTSTGGSFRAVYSGDGNYLTSTGDCEPIAASKLSSSTVTVIHLGTSVGEGAPVVAPATAPIGTIVHDKATVSGSGPAPTGTVAFTWYTNTTCTGDGVSAGATVAVGAGGVAHPSSDETLTSTGGSFRAVYSGDGNYLTSTGDCEPIAASKLSSSTVTVIHLGTSVGEGAPVVAPATAPIGTIVHDKATVSGSGPAPTGTVAFTWYTNTTCTGDGVSAGATVAVGAGGVAHPSSDETLTSTGGSFRAVYSGDGNYLTSTGDCEPIAASKLSSSTVTVIHLGTSVGEGAPVVAPATAPIGTIVHDKATVSGSGPAPTGTVAFTWYTNTTCTGDGVSAGATVAVGAGGVAHPSSDETLTSTGGSFRAVYSGDANYLTSTGDCEPIAASKLSSSTVTVIHLGTSVGEGAPVVAPATAPIGTIVHDKATVSGSGPAPTGTVAFTWYTNTTCTGDGVSAGATVAVGAGGVAHPSSDETLTSTGGSFRAVYSGDANYLTSTGDCEPIAASKLSSSTVTVIHLGTSVGEGAPVVAPATAPIGTIVHDKATVSGSGPAPTGTVAFTWYTNTTCTGDGVGAGATVAVGAGGVAHPSSDETLTSTGGSFRAVYSGDANYLGSTGDCEPIAASKLSSSTVTVIHLGTSVGEGAPVVAPATAPIGTIVHDKATVSGSGPAPTGTVAFTWYTNTTCTGDGVSAGATVAVGAGGVAHPSSDETLTSTGGSFRAVYSGDANYLTSTGDCEPIAASKLSSSTVTVIHLGKCATSYGYPQGGTGGSTCDTTSATPITSATVGSIVHDMATVTGSGPTPTGTVTFTWYNNTTCTGTGTAAGTVTLVNGIAHPSDDETLTASGGSFKATYNGDSVYLTSTGACEPLTATKKSSSTVTVIHAGKCETSYGYPQGGSGGSTCDTTSATPITSATVGSIVHDMATVTGSGPTPTGTVTFTWYNNTTCTGTGTSAGTVTLVNGIAHPSDDETLTASGGSFKATYNGDATYTGSTGACEPLTATKKSSSTVTVIHAGKCDQSYGYGYGSGYTLGGSGSSDCDTTSATPITSATVGSIVHDMATVTGSGPTPTGTVTFTWYNNTTCTGTGTSAGTVTLVNGIAHPSDDETLTASGGSFKAVYNGDSVYTGSTGACEPLTVKLKDSTTVTDIHAGKCATTYGYPQTGSGSSGDCDSTSAPAITSATVGSIVHDEATVTGSGPTPTGTVTFTWYNNTTCTGTGVAAGTVTLVNGIAHPSNDETLTASGGSFKAVYNGNSIYKSSTGACEPLTVKKKDSHVETEIHAAGSSTPITTAAVGTTIHDKATVTGSGPTPTGSVTFKWYTTKDCSGSYTTKGTITLDSNGVAHPSSDVTVPSGGGSFKAFYGGDSVYNGDSSDCEPLSTPKKTSYTDTVIHQDGSSTPITSAYIGSIIHDSATVTGSGSTPTGSVTFKWYTTQDCSGSYSTKGTISLNSSGVAHPSSDVTVPAGGGSFKAFYGGDSAYNSSVSDCEPLTAKKKTSYVETEIHASGSSTPITSATVGTVVHDKATVTGSGPTPTGSVTFKWYTTQDCSGSYTTKGTITLDSNGVAHPSNDVTMPSSGGSFKAFYSGDSTYNSSYSDCEPLKKKY